MAMGMAARVERAAASSFAIIAVRWSYAVAAPSFVITAVPHAYASRVDATYSLAVSCARTADP
jgi:hypothetical protein